MACSWKVETYIRLSLLDIIIYTAWMPKTSQLSPYRQQPVQYSAEQTIVIHTMTNILWTKSCVSKGCVGVLPVMPIQTSHWCLKKSRIHGHAERKISLSISKNSQTHNLYPDAVLLPETGLSSFSLHSLQKHTVIFTLVLLERWNLKS